MIKADYRGARGSNAGDDYHELWALRHALSLLEPDIALTAITVEGLSAEDESGSPKDTWDGVDCTFYFGEDSITSAQRIIVEQLKYSAASPDQAWSTARLTSSTGKKQNNSIVAKLAKAFKCIHEKRPEIVKGGNLAIRLVSNQPIDSQVVTAVTNRDTTDENYKNLQTASGLNVDDFNGFLQCLDFSECGNASRFALEERVLATISEWTDDDARSAINDLMRYIQRAMLPESKELITRQSVLTWMGFSDPGALFPCPSVLKKLEQPILRQACQAVTQEMLRGNQRICLHGEGGCGKTTALQGIETLLPAGSVMIVFDCYGGGRYLDSDAYRHRPQDAFLQLSNDLALQLRIPLLVSRSPHLDYPRTFKKRLDRAAEVVTSHNHNALLVVVVDAADNSVTAAQIQSERSFVHDFVALGDLPENVRLILTARTGRLPTLNLPRNFTPIEIAGFNLDETSIHVRGMWNDAPDAWIDDFQHLSGGNPRVQWYALDYAKTEPVQALAYLRPNGKSLDQVFQEKLQQARLKVGQRQDIKTFCSGLIALPRSIPVGALAAVTELSESHLRDLCADLAPGIRLVEGSIGFADEDFEHFIRAEAEEQLGSIQTRAADHLLSRYKSDSYAATHVVTALFNAGRRQAIIDLISAEREPTAIVDPVLRREAQLQRLKMAMKVCREAGNTTDAILTLLIGAEALMTDTTIRQMLIENPDLSANFARDTSFKSVLRNPDEIDHHGPFLFQLMAVDARRANGISTRESGRQVNAWMQRRREVFEQQKKEHPGIRPQGWSISNYDIAAETEAILRLKGPQDALDYLLRWSPKTLAIQVALILASRLITSDEGHLIENCIVEASIPSPWKLFLLTPLALAGKEIDLSVLESELTALLNRQLIRLDKLNDSWREDNDYADYLEMILTACEVIITHKGDNKCVISVLEKFAEPESRRYDRLSTSQILFIDFSLRAYTLLERLAGRQPTKDTYLIAPPEPSDEMAPGERERRKRTSDTNKEELQSFIGALIDVYDVRAQALLGVIQPEQVEIQLQKPITRYLNESYRFDRQPYSSRTKVRMAFSIARLMVVPGLNRALIFTSVQACLKNNSATLRTDDLPIFANLALDHSLHLPILKLIAERTKIVKNLKISADDKITALTRFSRLLLPISVPDAESIFKDAVDIASEVNAEAVNEIALFAPFAGRAVESMNITERRHVAHNLAVVVSDAGVRLADHKSFPWEEAAQAFATLDVSLALAATARWEDEGITDSLTFLPPILETALTRHEMTPNQVAALSSLLNEFSDKLIGQIVDESMSLNEYLGQKLLAEHLAQEEILRFGNGSRPKVVEKLRLVTPEPGIGFWVEQLERTTAFYHLIKPGHTTIAETQEKWHDQGESSTKRGDPLACIDWSSQRFVSTKNINDVINEISVAAQALKQFVPVSTILDRMGSVTRLSDRVAHLEALCSNESTKLTDHERTQAIIRRVNEWYEAPSITRWCRDRLIHVIIEWLPGLSFELAFEKSSIQALLTKTKLPSSQVCTFLFDAMERHVDRLTASTIYAVVGLISQYSEPGDTAQVILRYAERLVQRIAISERDIWQLADIPSNTTDSIARLLYAYMGDIDVRIRWRAAHALRNLARLGEFAVVDATVKLYDNRMSEPSYRALQAPFYWLAARLWLLIALDRIATETPLAVERHGFWLLEIATDKDFPHILIRSFAKSALQKLTGQGHLTLDSVQSEALNHVNTSSMHQKRNRKVYEVGFDKYTYKDREERRFHFDFMDTLPYWYTGAVQIFANISEETFLDTAEQWIVDRWNVRTDPWRWEDEPRKYRLSDRSYASVDHRHGSLPTLERYSTHLEWHAMWCATGQLMQTHAIAEADEDEHHRFDSWVARDGFTMPPLWLSDLHGPKPLEDRFWTIPYQNIDLWVEEMNEDDFFAELGLANDEESIVVSEFYETRSCDFKLSGRIRTALVSPETAGALMRALQTINDSWDYRMPSAGEDSEIDYPPYKLIGWLIRQEHFTGIDENDPFNYGVNAIESEPSSATIKALDLIFTYGDQAEWKKASGGTPIFLYESWGDNRADEREDNLRYDKAVRSSGWRLRFSKEALNNFLNEMGYDLIMEIEITRGNKGYYGYSAYDEEKKKESEFDRVILFRKDGTIEAAEGCLGTWTTPRS